MIDWKTVPRQALVDALRNAMIGPGNLSRQDKRDLVAIAERALSTLKEPARGSLLAHIQTETTYQNDRKRNGTHRAA